jgi:hypothetical protein
VVEKRIIFEGHSAGSKPSLPRQRESSQPRRIFLLSPANASGVRAKMLFGPRTQFDLAERLRHPGVPLGEVYSFVSGLYFRGKLAYAERFANPSPGVAGVHIITAGGGLMLPDSRVTLAELREISATALDPTNHEYRRPLDRDAYRLRTLLEPETEVVLLGSIATPKYVEPLLEVFGERLVFPKEFVGRGDMSRGGLLLRCCSEGLPLEYVPVRSTVRHGRRPPKLSAKRTQIRRKRK